MSTDRCPWCEAKIQTDRMMGRGCVPRWDPPRIEWTCGSGQLSKDVEPTQTDKCQAAIFREVEELRGEVCYIRKQRDDLLWFLTTDFKERNPIVIEPEWLTVAASLREAAEAAGGEDG
ncbi:hypothetical protein LCGC14_1204680 [marine sediment metagenome]|uniref:Uncharacterized protein n=1 Tax=marine sediment metagenome TaxID=412755 RepID=A0A0F9LKA2_9ZZZZ